jgi:hypothetical protein
VPIDPNAPWLTVVTVSLRDDEDLSATVASLDQQDTRSVEHVVVLGEQPGPGPVSQPRQGNRLLLCRPPDGVYAAMNAGLDAATGGIVHFLNAGDTYVSSDILAKVRQVQEVTHFEWAFGRLRVTRHPDDPGRTRGHTIAEMRARKFRGMYFPEHPTVFARRALLKRLGGFDTSYRIAADYRLLLEMASSTPGIDLGFEITRYSLGGLSDKDWRASVRECHRARMEYLRPTGLAAVGECVHEGAALASQGVRRVARVALHRTGDVTAAARQ